MTTQAVGFESVFFCQTDRSSAAFVSIFCFKGRLGIHVARPFRGTVCRFAHFESHVHPFAAGTMASDDSDLFNVAMLIDELKVRVRQAREDARTPAAATPRRFRRPRSRKTHRF